MFVPYSSLAFGYNMRKLPGSSILMIVSGFFAVWDGTQMIFFTDNYFNMIGTAYVAGGGNISEVTWYYVPRCCCYAVHLGAIAKG
jgi:hypothetical protein